MTARPTPVVFIPALLSDEAMYREVIEQLGDTIEAQVMVLSEPTMQANVEAVLAKAPPTFVLAGTSYGGSIALEVALAAPSTYGSFIRYHLPVSRRTEREFVPGSHRCSGGNRG